MSVDRSVYMDPSKSVDERTAALLAQMTLEEKQAQTIHLTGYNKTSNSKQFKQDYGKTGIGAVPGGYSSASAMAIHNELQMWFINHTRLGIPITFHSEVRGDVVFEASI